MSDFDTYEPIPTAELEGHCKFAYKSMLCDLNIQMPAADAYNLTRELIELRMLRDQKSSFISVQVAGHSDPSGQPDSLIGEAALRGAVSDDTENLRYVPHFKSYESRCNRDSRGTVHGKKQYAKECDQ